MSWKARGSNAGAFQRHFFRCISDILPETIEGTKHKFHEQIQEATELKDLLCHFKFTKFVSSQDLARLSSSLYGGGDEAIDKTSAFGDLP